MTFSLAEGGSLLYRWTDHTPDALFQARVALRRAAEKHGLSADAAGDVLMAGGELMANAVEHARGPYELHGWRQRTEFFCGVVDHDPHLPNIPDLPAERAGLTQSGPGSDAGWVCASGEEMGERGRGLRIVTELSRGVWGMRVLGCTKVLWCSIALT